MKRIFKFFRNLFHDEFEDQREAELVRGLQAKQASLREFNGKMHVSDRGGLSLRFKTKADECAYNRHLAKSWKSKTEEKK
jgi:hypothetical protein